MCRSSGLRHPTSTLATLAAELAAGRASSRSLVEACLASIDDSAGEGCRTFLQVDRAAALARADAIDAQRAGGAALPPYAGIPVSIKDLFDIAGQVTRAASTVLSDRAPAATDALSVARLRQAGLVIIGRTNMTEFAFSGLGMNPHYGTPLNPWRRDQGHIPGGSSSGAAVSVADGMAHGALGTDTGGSCRIPAAFTGLVGYKPTAARVPRDGVLPLSPSLDSVGPIARSVDCCAQLDALLADEPAPQLSGSSLSGRHFALPRTVVLADMDRHVAAHLERALARLATHAASYDPRIRIRILIGASQSAADYSALLEARKRFIAQVEARLDGFDAFLMPTVPVIAPRIAELTADDDYLRMNALVLRNSTLVNFLDGCAISIPMHAAGEPPTGLTLACRGGEDRQLFHHAAAAEAALAQHE
jgi:aspartyl-tRNA(Asn)/glutamyl-tRNA(Gln) amidotransferase subunit A